MDMATAVNGVVGSIAFFGFLTAIIIVPRWLKSRDRRELQQTLRQAMEKGQPLPAEAIEAITSDARRPPSPERDFRAGFIFLAAGLGLALFGMMLGAEDGDFVYPLVGIGGIPAMIGLALITLGVIGRNHRP
jgi:hypothetical protein